MHRIALLRESFGHVAPMAGRVAALFCERLMNTDSSPRPLFAMAAQRTKLMQAIGMAVASLERPDLLLPCCRIWPSAMWVTTYNAATIPASVPPRSGCWNSAWVRPSCHDGCGLSVSGCIGCRMAGHLAMRGARLPGHAGA